MVYMNKSKNQRYSHVVEKQASEMVGPQVLPLVEKGENRSVTLHVGDPVR